MFCIFIYILYFIMLTRTYLDKVVTIVKDSKLNSGLNPVAELHYGKGEYSRILIHFDHNEIKSKIEDKTFANVDKLHHYLHITNAGSIDFTDLHCCKLSEISDNKVVRAASFDLIFFLLPQKFDMGKGFDMINTKFTLNHGRLKNGVPNLTSEDGCNWYQARNGYNWKEEGVYSNDTLSKEYDNFSSENGSPIIFARQHFDIGNEDVMIDITNLMNQYINGELENNGIGIAFTPMTEITLMEQEQYCGLLTNKTNTFFEPHVVTVYDDFISDDRGSFTINKKNKLYLYCNIGGIATNLDELPVCTIDNINYEVKQYGKGIYYAEVLGDRNTFNPNQMYYDVWSNIKVNGVKFDDVEMDFVVHPISNYFNFGNTLDENIKFSPVIYGIKENEKIHRGDIRKVTLISRQNYSSNKCNVVDEAYYRLYIMDGTRPYDVISWTPINKTVKENFFVIDTKMLIPQRYYIDIKYKYNMEEICENNVLSFDITDDINNRYN